VEIKNYDDVSHSLYSSTLLIRSPSAIQTYFLANCIEIPQFISHFMMTDSVPQ